MTLLIFRLPVQPVLQTKKQQSNYYTKWYYQQSFVFGIKNSVPQKIN